MANSHSGNILFNTHCYFSSEVIMKSILFAVLLSLSTLTLAEIVIVQTPGGGQTGCIVLKGFISCQ
jgi:hypothetical protein